MLRGHVSCPLRQGGVQWDKRQVGQSTKSKGKSASQLCIVPCPDDSSGDLRQHQGRHHNWNGLPLHLRMQAVAVLIALFIRVEGIQENAGINTVCPGLPG